MPRSSSKLGYDYANIDEYIDDARTSRGVPPQVSCQFTTWFERQLARLAQLSASPTRPLMEEEREGLEEQLFVGTSVQVCEMPTPGDEYFFAFALNTPVANALYNVHPNVVVQMALRMRMLAAQHWSPHVLIQQAGATNGPLLLFCSVKRPRCPGQVRLASIALSGSSHWYTHVGNLTRQILLVHELAELRPMFQAPEHLDYLLAWPKTAAEEQED